MTTTEPRGAGDRAAPASQAVTGRNDACTAPARALGRDVDLILSLQDPSGAYPACPTFAAYRGYSWFRDGAFIAEAASRAGRALGRSDATESAIAFHDWCARVLTDRAGHIASLVERAAAGEGVPHEQMLPTRFTLDGADGAEDWWDFQLDGYGTWLWAVTVHAARHGLDLARWSGAITLAVDYLTAFWAEPCFDWWEEHAEHRHVSTLGALVGGLESAALATLPGGSSLLDPARRVACTETCAAIRALVAADGTTPAGHLRKWLGSDAVDASLAACVVPFGLVPPGSPTATATLDAIARDLEADGGVHRFAADVFYGGGQWPLLSCLLGWNLATAGDRSGAERLLAWARSQADAAGALPEQVPHHLLHPEHREEWLAKWGPVARPLLWSHAMVLILADELGTLALTSESA